MSFLLYCNLRVPIHCFVSSWLDIRALECICLAIPLLIQIFYFDIIAAYFKKILSLISADYR